MRRSPGTTQVVRGRVYGRFWFGDSRDSVPMPGVPANNAAAIRARCELIADTIMKLTAAGRGDRARDFAVQLGEATSVRRLEAVAKAVESFLQTSGPVGANVTIRQFGERWTTGDLARAYPDHVRTKSSAKDDESILEKYVYPLIGSTPIRAMELADAERVMAGVPPERSRARRRHVAQALHRLCKLAVYPAKVLKVSPLPAGFLPKLGGDKAKQYLYPDEDARLMACTAIPIVYRLFYGLLAREGMRFTEAHLLEWADLDLDRGVVRLDENKTDDPRSWALDPDVSAALRTWRDRKGKTDRPFADVDTHHPAERFREEHLKAAGIDRPELFVDSEVRKPIRVHDLRATFVTVALACGKTETWVQDRTGHKSTLMIARYRRAARTLGELKMGPLEPLYAAIEWRQDLPTGVKRKVAPPGFEPGTPSRAADFKTEIPSSEGVSRRENKRAATSDDEASRPFAGRLTLEPLENGAVDLKQIRTEWAAFEAAVEGMDPDAGGAS
jgi:integrase